MKSKKQRCVALYGGRPSRRCASIPGVRVQRWGSSRDAGQGATRDLVRAIKQGTILAVVVLTRWVGHSDLSRVKTACRQAHVQIRFVRGGQSASLKITRTLVAEVLHG